MMPTPKMTDERATELLAKHGDQPVRHKQLGGIMDAIAGVIRQHTESALGPLLKRIDALERENAELKAASEKSLADCYRGVWQPSTFDPYARGVACTFDGSLWIARTETRSKPGTDDSWQLAVKRGRDGKDATP